LPTYHIGAISDSVTCGLLHVGGHASVDIPQVPKNNKEEEQMKKTLCEKGVSGRTTSRREFVSLVALGALTLGLASAASLPAFAQSSKTIAVSFPNSSKIGAVIISLDQAKKRAAELGYELVVDDPGSDMNKQVNAIKTWIEQKVAVIVCNVPNPAAFETLAKQAREAGIYWITYGDRITNQDATVGYDQYNDGRKLGAYAGQWINENLGGEAKVALLGFDLMIWGQARTKGIEEGLAEAAPKAAIVAKQNAITPTEGLNVTRTILQANPEVNVILGVEDPATEGAYKAWVASGRDPKQGGIFIGGMDGTAPALTLLQQGDNVYKASMAIPLRRVGDAIAETAHELVTKGKAPDNIVPLELVASGSPLAAQYLAEPGGK
jgi:ribose transport system substrate-binding protein